jgi:truncated hemoglobin YjbI
MVVRIADPCRARSRRALTILFAAITFLFVATAHPLRAADPPNKASSSKSNRDEAVRSVPLATFSPDIRDKVSTCLNDASLYRRLPIQVVDCEPDLFRYVVENPDIMVNIWQLMGVTNVTLQRTDADHFRCSDGDGTTAQVQVVSRSSDTQVIYAEGNYDGPLFPRAVHGQCVIVLKYVSLRQSGGRFYQTVRLDTFLRVDNIGLDLLAKLFQGMVGKTIDHNFSETVAFMGSMSHTAEVNPHGMRRMLNHMANIDDVRRDQFLSLTDQVAEKIATGPEHPDPDVEPAMAEVVQSRPLAIPQSGAKR